MELDDNELLYVVRKELRELLGLTTAPLFCRIYRWERANPQYDVEHLAHVAALENSLPPAVWVTGSPYRGVGLPDCVRQAQATAMQVVDGLGQFDHAPLAGLSPGEPEPSFRNRPGVHEGEIAKKNALQGSLL